MSKPTTQLSVRLEPAIYERMEAERTRLGWSWPELIEYIWITYMEGRGNDEGS